MIAGGGSAARRIAGNENGFRAAKPSSATEKREVKRREIDGEGVRNGAGGGGICVIGGDGGGAGERLDAESRSQHFILEAQRKKMKLVTIEER